MTTLTCHTCGVRVEDLVKHNEWHEKINTSIIKISEFMALGFKTVNCEIAKLREDKDENSRTDNADN